MVVGAAAERLWPASRVRESPVKIDPPRADAYWRERVLIPTEIRSCNDDLIRAEAVPAWKRLFSAWRVRMITTGRNSASAI